MVFRCWFALLLKVVLQAQDIPPGKLLSTIEFCRSAENVGGNVGFLDVAFGSVEVLVAKIFKQSAGVRVTLQNTGIEQCLQLLPFGPEWRLGRSGGSDNMVPYPTTIQGKNGSDSIAVSLTHIFSPTMTSETSFGYTYINFPNSPSDPTKLLKTAANYPYKGIYNTSDALPVIQGAWDNTIPNLGVAGFSFNPLWTLLRASLLWARALPT